jgi:hypothetical protein
VSSDVLRMRTLKKCTAQGAKFPVKNSPYIYDVSFLALLRAPYIYDISKLKVKGSVTSL